MASFSQGDKVEALVKINGGFFDQDVPAGTWGYPQIVDTSRLRGFVLG